jgi:tRNA threonylcarbamoyladenosine biosynthesis protein TsaE
MGDAPAGGTFGSATLETASEAETEAAGEQLARTLTPGAVVLLYGDLGAGKTAFVRGMARGLGAAPDDVSSPTFTIMQEYGGGSIRLHHVDLYRLSPAEIDDLGLDDLIDGGAIVAVEWADRWRRRPHSAIHVSIGAAGGDRRTIEIHD